MARDRHRQQVVYTARVMVQTGRGLCVAHNEQRTRHKRAVK